MIQFIVKDYNYSYEVVSNDDRLRKKLSNHENVNLHINTLMYFLFIKNAVLQLLPVVSQPLS